MYKTFEEYKAAVVEFSTAHPWVSEKDAAFTVMMNKLAQALTPPLEANENSMRDGGLQGLPDARATAERNVRGSARRD